MEIEKKYGPGTGGAHVAWKQSARRKGKPNHSTNVITKRQRQIMTLVFTGMGQKEISEQTNLSLANVYRQTKLVRDKLGLHNTKEAARLLKASGLLDEPHGLTHEEAVEISSQMIDYFDSTHVFDGDPS